MDDPDAEALIGISAWILARDIRSYQALVTGLPVPLWRLDAGVLERIGIDSLEDKSIVMTHELALLVEVHRPFRQSKREQNKQIRWNAGIEESMRKGRAA